MRNNCYVDGIILALFEVSFGGDPGELYVSICWHASEALALDF